MGGAAACGTNHVARGTEFSVSLPDLWEGEGAGG